MLKILLYICMHHVSQGHQPRPKMVTISFRTINFMQLMRRFKCSLESSVFFFLVLGGGGDGGSGRGICFAQFVPTVFPSSLQGVPSKFPNSSQYVSNSTTLLSHMLWPKLNFHNYRLQRQATRKNLCAFSLESAQCFKNSVNGSVNQCGSLKKKYIYLVFFAPH